MSMNYEEAVHYRDAIQKGEAIKPGLDIITKLLEYLGNPQDRLKFIHIAGTNGKGSTATFITAVLAKMGKNVGRFVSPVVFDDMEKIQYQTSENSVYMRPEEYAEQMERVQMILNTDWEVERVPTVFEIETAIAFCLFEKWNCDIVVLEVGMGGAEDSTNVVKNVLASVITPISLDHMEFLGDTLEQISSAKAGIIKESVPVFSYQPDNSALFQIQKKAVSCNSKLSLVEIEKIVIKKSTLQGTWFEYKNCKELFIPLCGEHQVYNACLAIECLLFLGASQDVIRQGFEKVSWPGRFEVVKENPFLILDGAHNVAGIAALKKALEFYLNNRKIVGIMGVFEDKQYEEMVREIIPCFEKIYAIKAPTSRGLEKETLVQTIHKYGGLSEGCDSLEEAIEKAKMEEKPIIIFGSLSIMREAKRRIV